MKNGRITEFLIVQGAHSPGDAISIGTKVLKVTVRALPTSQNDVFVGMNQQASTSNILEPGDSVTYHDERVYLDKNSLYVSFDTAGGPIGGQALISIMFEGDDENCS
jgi:hypothetical protein